MPTISNAGQTAYPGSTASGNAPGLSWAYLKGMIAYLTNPNVTGMYGMWDSPSPGLHSNGQVTPGEGGVDLGAPKGTPIYALATGPIVGIGQWNDGEHQVITQRVNVPGAGAQDLYYQHLYLSPGLKQGQVVQKGQQIGTVGAYNETEIGFNAAWGGIWGTNHPGPWAKDPRPWLKALMTDTSASLPPGSPGSTQQNCGPTDFGCMLNNWWTSQVTPTLKQWGEYIAIFTIALILIIVGFFLIAGKSIVQTVKDVPGQVAKAAL